MVDVPSLIRPAPASDQFGNLTLFDWYLGCKPLATEKNSHIPTAIGNRLYTESNANDLQDMTLGATL
jgi:hypothetical protein